MASAEPSALAIKAAAEAGRRRRAKADGPLVSIRVLKKGDGKISLGEHDPATFANLYAETHDVVHEVPLASAQFYEDDGMAEIVEPEPDVDVLEGQDVIAVEIKRGPGRPPKAQ